ncbi:MAG: hypothetical protein AAF636_14285 [Pseudomonadota bacterium]
MRHITLQLAGPVRLVRDDGRDLTPVSLKARGILALLGTTKDYRLTRAALIDKLWSFNDQKQGSSNLRQALHAIRTTLGEEADVLITQSNWVGLNEASVYVDLAPAANLDEIPEFASDLEISDPEFEDWIRDRRLHFDELWSTGDDATNPTLSIPTLVIGESLAATDDLRIGASILLNDIAEKVARIAGLKIRTILSSRTNAFVISCQIAQFGSRVMIQPHIRKLPEDSIIWSNKFDVEATDVPMAFSVATEQASLAIFSELAKPVSSAAPVLPLRDIFGLEPNGLTRADTTLRNRLENEVSAPLLALRAYIRHTQYLERFSKNSDETLAEALDLSRQALEISPGSPIALAVSSLFQGIDNKPQTALDLSISALELMPDDPFILHCASTAWSFAGKHTEAALAARRARQQHSARFAPQLHHLRASYASIGVLDQKTALREARLAVERSPDFRAAVRVLATLEYEERNFDTAQFHLHHLKALEPNFSLELMASDDYPVDTLRSANLLAITKSGLL